LSLSKNNLWNNSFKASKSISLANLVLTTATRLPAKPAVVCGDRSMTYGDFYRFICSVDKYFRDIGIKRGDRVAVRVRDKLDFIKTIFAVMCSGAIAVAIDRADAEGQTTLVADADPSLVLHDDSTSIAASDHADRLFKSIGTLDMVEETEISFPGAEDHALILYTSGTHGRRKGVILTHANLVATAHYIVSFTGLKENAVELITAPVEHAFGFGRCRCLFAVGGTLVLDPQPFNPIRVIASLGKYECNAMSSVSTGYAMLLEHFGDAFAGFGEKIRWLEIGSAPLSSSLIERLCLLFPHANVVMNYGMTEAQRTTLIDFQREREKQNTVGRASPSLEVRICDKDRRSLPQESVGIIEVSGPNVAAGYWRNESMWNERYQEGWFQTDDIGTLDNEGYLRFICRRDDMINIGGEKVSPIHIENSMRQYLDGVSYTVCAMKDPDGIYGEVPALCIEERVPDSFSWKDLRIRMLNRMEKELVPRIVVLLTAFPRTQNGKIQRKKVRELLEEGAYELL